MAISASISRATAYYARHGFGPTIRRVFLAAKRALLSSRMVLFYCDLSAQSLQGTGLPNFLKVERHRNQADFNSQDIEKIVNFWNPKLAGRNISERFELGASLWLVRFEDELAGYGWTLQGRTVEPHYFQLGPSDIHCFDFHVFPQYRGRGINPLLVNHILESLATECHGRAFIEAAEWNHAQLASLKRTSFHRLGLSKKFTILGRIFVRWYESETVEQMHPRELQRPSIPASKSQ